MKNKVDAEMIRGNIAHIRQEIAQTCKLFVPNRTAQPEILAVSKTMPAEAVVAAARAGQRGFGENYVQEGIDKIQAVAALEPELAANLQWHLIGPLQSNKTRVVAENFDWVHTVDRLKTAQRLSAQRPSHLPPLQVLIQINIDASATKAGLAPDEVLPLALAIQALPQIQLRGLMAMPDAQTDSAALVALFRQVANLLGILRKYPQLASESLDTLSMGMSGDMREAIIGGSTLLRIGSAIFGLRAAAKP